jgi:hypothetical protein
MRRIALLGTLVAGLTCALALSTPRPLHAVLCCDNGGYTTSLYWVWEPTCSEAQAAFRSEALPEAQAYCGGTFLVCATTVPGCYWYEGKWVVSGAMTFGCKDSCPRDPFEP